MWRKDHSPVSKSHTLLTNLSTQDLLSMRFYDTVTLLHCPLFLLKDMSHDSHNHSRFLQLNLNIGCIWTFEQMTFLILASGSTFTFWFLPISQCLFSVNFSSTSSSSQFSGYFNWNGGGFRHITKAGACQSPFIHNTNQARCVVAIELTAVNHFSQCATVTVFSWNSHHRN